MGPLSGAPLAGGWQPGRRRPPRGLVCVPRAARGRGWRRRLACAPGPAPAAGAGGVLRRRAPAACGGQGHQQGAGRSWKVHFFEFRVAWKRLVQERTGRLLIQVGAQLPCGRGPNESLSLWALLESAEKPQTYGVYDVTSFADDHPGSDLVLRSAAGLVDATGTFESAAHSDAALRRLASLAVPGLEALPYDYELEKMRWRQLSAWQSPDFQVFEQGIGVVALLACYSPQASAVTAACVGLWLWSQGDRLRGAGKERQEYGVI
ncbi:unnamed protein product [Prorocentrum cordatum]|uniref:Cytochrome b5 heme-binding domain-containing protein n=1 Tax=Prorocentrum cordatum TaxID=2364126 RepID=A0ABN9XQR7_9DINO|nr:unnamed protein product [Polarella glacialis]